MGGAVLIGRDVELAELGVLVGPGQLVTLTGPGGVGKTTLATEFAGRRAQRVVVVDLAGVERSADVASGFAASLGQSSFELISASTFADEGIVVVDNCEHVLDAAAAAIAELRTLLPGIAVLATSRAPLGLREEIVVPVAPLGVPPPDVADPATPAVEMFLSVAARAGGRVEPAELADVCELVRRVDGVPLAIEIVATRTRSMSVAEIRRRLGDRLDTVGQGGFRRDPRQRSVRDTVEWSYQLLDRHERRLFDRLGVHAGGYSATTAHGVAGDDDPIEDTLDRLDRLVAASLLVPTRSVDGSTWYHQLQAVRSCALEHLEASGEREATAERFVDQMVAEARSLAAGAERGGTAWSVAMMVMLLDGFLVAVRWATEHDDSPERALGIIPVLWGHQSRTEDVLAASRGVIERWPDVDHPGWADAAAIVATCLWLGDETEAAEEMLARAHPVEDDAAWAPVMLRRVRGLIEWSRGRSDDALAAFADAAERARRAGLAWFVVDAELLQAGLLAAMDDTDGALRITRRVRGLGPDHVLAVGIAMSIESDALLERDVGASIELARAGRDLARSSGYSAAVVGFARTLAIGLALEDDLAGAAAALAEGLEIVVRSGVTARSPVLEAASVIAHRAGHTAWPDLARAAAACPPVPLLQSAARLLPDLPATDTPVLDVAGALALADRVLDDVAAQEAGEAERAGAAERAGEAVRAGAAVRAGEAVRAGDVLRAGDTADVAGAEAAGGGSAEAPPSERGSRGNAWERRGDHWEIVFDDRSVTVRNMKGIEDLARLVGSPDVEITAIDLIGAAVTSGDTGEVLDADARRRYEDRIRELQADLADAEDGHDIGRAERITVELDALVEHLTAAVGLAGRTRRSGATTERARTAVTRRIRTAIAHLLDVHPSLGRHLDVSVRTGTYCAYRPDRRIDWHVTR